MKNVQSGGGQLLLNRRAFTLIELLAVIVILAIIALIAVPIILNIIDDAKKESDERSVELYADAIKNGIASYQLNEDAAPTEFSQIESYIKYDGARVECTTKEIYADGNIYLDGCTVNGGSKTYSYGKQKLKIYENGEEVYFDVTKGTACTKEEYESSYGTVTMEIYDGTQFVDVRVEMTDYLNSLTEYNGVTKASDLQNSCLKFYAFNDAGSDKVNLLLDHNINESSYWDGYWGSTGYNTTTGPRNLLEGLKARTSSWAGTETPTNYSLDQSTVSKGSKYTIDYTGYKARLITAEEIAQITGNTTWDVTSETSYGYYFDSLTSTASDTCKYDWRTQTATTSGCKYGWLYDRTGKSCTTKGCLNNTQHYIAGYWTASTDTTWLYAWSVLSSGQVSSQEAYRDEIDEYGIGLRPVIEVLKSKLN